MFALGCIAGEQEEVVDRDGAGAVHAFHVHDGVQGDEGDGQVGGVGGDAVLARAEDRMTAVDALQRGTAAPGTRLLQADSGSR